MAAAELHPELDRVLVETLERSDRPLSVNQLHQRLHPPFRFPERLKENVKDLLTEIAKQGRIFVWPGKFSRYWRQSPEDWAYERACKALAEGPLQRGDLLQRMTSRTHSIAKEHRARHLAEWRRQGKLVLEPRRGPRWRLAVTAAIPNLKAELLRIALKLRAQGIDPAAVLEAQTTSSTAEGGPTDPLDHPAQLILTAMDRLMPEPGAVVSVSALRSDRSLAGIDKKVFDATVVDLVRKGVLSPHEHNAPYTLPEDRRRALVAAGPNLFYVAFGRR